MGVILVSDAVAAATGNVRAGVTVSDVQAGIVHFLLRFKEYKT